jgi:hypothetical protein
MESWTLQPLDGEFFNFFDFGVEVSVAEDLSVNLWNPFFVPKTFGEFWSELFGIFLCTGLVEGESGELGSEEFGVCAEEATANP